MIQNVTRNKAILAIASIIIGVLLIIFQRSALDAIIRTLGWILVVTGGVYLLVYLFGPSKDSMQIGFAGLAGLAGLIMIFFAPSIVNFFPIMMGIILILNGLGTLVQASQDEVYPLYSKIFAVLTVVLGILILVQPGQVANILMIIIGAGFVINGINDLILCYRYWKHIGPTQANGTVE